MTTGSGEGAAFDAGVSTDGEVEAVDPSELARREADEAVAVAERKLEKERATVAGLEKALEDARAERAALG